MIQARFDKRTHIIFCVFGIITNFVVATTVLVGAVASISYSFQNIASEYSIFLLLVPAFIFVFIGGLGYISIISISCLTSNICDYYLSGFFYVSYFTTLAIISVVIVLFVNAFYIGQSYPSDVGDIYEIFKRFECIQIPNNSNHSFKSFYSSEAFLLGLNSSD